MHIDANIIAAIKQRLATFEPKVIGRDSRGCKIKEDLVIKLRVRRDVRVFESIERSRRVNPGAHWSRAHFETYRNEQLRLFAETHVEHAIEVAVIDLTDTVDREEGRSRFRLELASEQHLWDVHRVWGVDPVPTIIAELDDDDDLRSHHPYEVIGFAD